MFKTFSRYLILVSILFIGALLRLSFLPLYPPGLTNDEVGEVYSAYSISQTGKDVFGNSYPLSINLDNSFPPVLIYVLALIFKFFPFSPYAGRYVVALSGVLTIYFFFRLVQRLTSNNNLALTSSFVLAISPWHIHLTRTSYGSALSLFFFLLAGYTLLLLMEKRTLLRIAISLISAFLAFASYHATKVIFFPFVVLFVWYFWGKGQKRFIVCWLTILSVLAGLFSYKIFIKDKLPYAAGSIIGVNQEKIEKIIRTQRDQMYTSPVIERIFRNKLTYLYDVFITQYLTAYSPEFFFTKGDGSGIYTIWGYGKQYSFEVLLFFIGVITGIQILKRRTYLLFLFWFLLGGLPAALTTAPDSMRQIITIIPLVGFISFGLYWFMKRNKTNILVFGVVYAFFIARFLIVYMFDYSINGAEYWFAGMKDMVSFVNQEKVKYEAVYISTQNRGDSLRDIMSILQYATFSQINPEELQKEFFKAEKNQGNISFGRIHFLGRCLGRGEGSVYDLLPKKTLYLLRPGICFQKDIPVRTLRSRDGKQDVWLIYTKERFL